MAVAAPLGPRGVAVTGEPGAVRLTHAEREILRPLLARYARWETAHDGPVFEGVERIVADRLAALTQDRDRYADEVLRWQVIAGEDAERLDETLAVVEAVRALILELNADADYRVPKRYLGDRLRALLPPTEPTAADQEAVTP